MAVGRQFVVLGYATAVISTIRTASSRGLGGSTPNSRGCWRAAAWKNSASLAGRAWGTGLAQVGWWIPQNLSTSIHAMVFGTSTKALPQLWENVAQNAYR